MIEFGSNFNFDKLCNEAISEDYASFDKIGYTCPLDPSNIVQLTPNAMQKVLFGQQWDSVKINERPWNHDNLMLYPSKAWREQVVRGKIKNNVNCFQQAIKDELKKITDPTKPHIETVMDLFTIALDEDIDYEPDFLNNECKITKGMLSIRNGIYAFNAWPTTKMRDSLERMGINFKPKDRSNKGLVFAEGQQLSQAGEAVASLLHETIFYSENSILARKKNRPMCLSPYSFERLADSATEAFEGSDITENIENYLTEEINLLRKYYIDYFGGTNPVQMKDDELDIDASIDDDPFDLN